MNQAASATGRPPAGSTATASCCPMFSNPFFMNTFAPQATLMPPAPAAQQCFLRTQATPIQPIASIQPPPSSRQQISSVSQHQPTVSQQTVVAAQTERSQQSQRLQDHSNYGTNSGTINLNNTGNNYSTSFSSQALSLQHLLANRHQATNCMALAAALASASFPHFQQLQQSQQNHTQSSATSSAANTATINQTRIDNNISVTTNDPANPAPHPNINLNSAALTSQVPLLNFNSYNTAPPNLNLPASNSSQPISAHLVQSSVNQQQQQQSNSTASSQTSGDTGLQNRPVTTSLENVDNQQMTTAYRRAPANQVGRPQQQQQTVPTSLSAQHITQSARAALNDETVSTLLNEQFQASMLLNQLLANNQLAAPYGPVPMPPQHVSQPQQLGSTQTNSVRSQFNMPNQVPLSIPPAQQISGRFVPAPRPEQVSGQQQQSNAPQANRLAQVPVSNDNVQQSTDNVYTSSQNSAPTTVGQIQQSPQSDQAVSGNPVQGPSPPAPTQPLSAQQPPQQQTQSIPTFYSVPQVEQALALLANPQIATNLFSHIFSNMYYQNGLRPEQHTHHNPSHHFHHHLHGAHHHHHHHHGGSGQGNGQDATVPVDSLAISESKPKGLNRAEIDSLTHYIHTDEKDSRTCVICLSKFELKSKIRPLSCNHAFHAKCVDKWLRANRTCPICRRDALKSYEGKIKRI